MVAASPLRVRALRASVVATPPRGLETGVSPAKLLEAGSGYPSAGWLLGCWAPRVVGSALVIEVAGTVVRVRRTGVLVVSATA